MDVPTLMHNLKEEITCSVCIHLYTNPKQLPCLHIFCLECLNNLARTNAGNGKIKCPICQTEVAVPESGTMETLPSCFYVKNLLDTLAIKECNTSKVTCGNCAEKSEEASYCFHCGKFWCKDCLNAHNIFKENKEHRVLALKDFQDEDFEDVLKRPAFCQKELHEKEVLKFYCKVCEVPVCQNCVIVEHNKHEVEYLEVCARATKNCIASRLQTIQKSSQTFSNSIQKLEKTNRVLEHRSQIITEQIQETAKSLACTIQQLEQELVDRVQKETETILQNNMKSKANFEDHLKKNEEIMKQAEKLLERSTGAELVANKTFIDELFKGLQEPQDSDLPSTTDWKTMTVFMKNDKISESLQELGIGHLATNKSVTEANQCSVERFQAATAGLETEIEVITRNSKGEQCYCPGDYVDVCITSTHSRNVAVETKIVDENNGRYAVSFIPREAGRHVLIAIQVNGDVIREFPPCDIKQRSFRPIKILGQGGIPNKNLNNPWGVAVSDSNEIFITDKMNNRIVVLNEKGAFVRSFGHDMVRHPSGICIDNQGSIFVANRRSNKILLFNPKGEYVRAVHSDGKILKEPRGISLDAQGNLIVCDAGNKCVRFISPEGDVFKTVEGLHMPFDCLCREDKVYVSDRNAHVIKVYSSDGRFLYEFGRHGSEDGELNCPTGLALDKAGHLLICCEENHTVQVFSLDGKFVTKFGDYGQQLGQIGRPTSVSVLKSGHIVTCEFGNGRLQIFA